MDCLGIGMASLTTEDWRPTTVLSHSARSNPLCPVVAAQPPRVFGGGMMIVDHPFERYVPARAIFLQNAVASVWRKCLHAVAYWLNVVVGRDANASGVDDQLPGRQLDHARNVRVSAEDPRVGHALQQVADRAFGTNFRQAIHEVFEQVDHVTARGTVPQDSTVLRHGALAPVA